MPAWAARAVTAFLPRLLSPCGARVIAPLNRRVWRFRRPEDLYGSVMRLSFPHPVYRNLPVSL